MARPLVVLKFGSSVLSHPTRLQAVVHEIYRSYRQGNQVIAVVSAIGQHTDALMAEATQIEPAPQPEEALAQLLSTGELQSAALLALALHRAGIPGTLLDPTGSGLILAGDRLDATPVGLDIDAVKSALQSCAVLAMPGFIGRHESGGTALMGRGGSDLTAVFLADRLDADECRLVKDVDGIYERDPAKIDPESPQAPPHRYGTVTYEEALRVAEVLIQPKAIEYLQSKHNTARVSALLHDEATEVGAAHTTTADVSPPPPLRVLLLGLGEVGQGVYAHLKELPEFFEVTGIHVRDILKHSKDGVPAGLLHTDIDKLIARPYDLVIDVSGHPTMAYTVIENSLKAGRSAVTANKQLVADRGAMLAAIASKTGAHFKYAATVGGGAPMVEAIQRVANGGGIVRLRGVLNGTCNYVLDSMAGGRSFNDAVADAQARGFAEADVTRDLSGKDTEDKLRILARLAFGAEHDGLPVWREGIEAVTPVQVGQAGTRGEVIRLVATLEPEGRAQVAAESLPMDDFLAGGKAEENRLVIEDADGQSWYVKGKGAGRWPTAEAVIADLVDIHSAAAAAAGKTPETESSSDTFDESKDGMGAIA